jgi:arylsulfatase A-like enzyme
MGRSLSRAAFLASLLQLGCGCGGDDRPSLLLITIETLRPDRLACYGGDPGIGTGICALANQGTRFVWSIAPAPATAPSIASILTSSWPSSHGVTEFASTPLSEQARTLAECLRDGGYETAAFVANPVLRLGRHFEQGFSIYDDRMTRREPNRPELLEREASEVTDAALAWLRVARRPWFLWIHYQDPHGPYQPPHLSRRRDPPDAPLLPLLNDHSGYQGIPAYQALPGLRSLQAYRERYQMRSATSTCVARLVPERIASGRGPGWCSPRITPRPLARRLLLRPRPLGDRPIRVPLIVRSQEPAPARVSTRPVSGWMSAHPVARRARRFPIPSSGSRLAARRTGEAPERAADTGRAAIVVGSTYYARDRAPIELGTPDEITGGRFVRSRRGSRDSSPTAALPSTACRRRRARRGSSPCWRAFYERPPRRSRAGRRSSRSPTARPWVRSATSSRGAARALRPLAALALLACAEPPPSIVLATLDTVRCDHLGLYGGPPELSPHLDALGARGLVHDSAYTTMPTTGPAHLSIFTGLHPSEHGSLANAEPVGSEHRPRELAGRLRERGYATGLCNQPALQPRATGLSASRSTTAGLLRPGEDAVRSALAWLDAEQRRPVFLWVHLFDAHSPYGTADEKGRSFPVEPGRYGWVDRDLYDPAERERTERRYARGIRDTDAALGALLEGIAGRIEPPPLVVVAGTTARRSASSSRPAATPTTTGSSWTPRRSACRSSSPVPASLRDAHRGPSRSATSTRRSSQPRVFSARRLPARSDAISEPRARVGASWRWSGGASNRVRPRACELTGRRPSTDPEQ